MNYRDFINANFEDAEKYGVYPKSVNKKGGSTVFMAEIDGRDYLVCAGDNPGFEGKSENGVLLAELNHFNAKALRKAFPFTAPTSALTKPASFGVGDRLGIAGPGHIRVFEEYDVTPVFAQQSIRELDLTERNYEQVLDSSSFSVFREGYRHGFGADGDHLKKASDVEYALGLGFTMITLDCSEHIQGGVDSLTLAEVEAKYVADKDTEERYLGKKFDLGEGVVLEFSKEELMRIQLIYGKAIVFAVEIYEKYFAGGKTQADFEVSIDETATPTTPLQHFFVANELIRRGVKPATVAPRFCGEFQKGVDYIGDIAQFDAEMQVHAVIARHFGYKISVHSGSDKFSVFPSVGRHTQGIFHVKTAGTNWLEAMRVVAMADPALYREVHKFALASFDEATKYYHVTTDLSKIADVDSLTDAQLPEYFSENDARQLIHITYGLILSKKDEEGNYVYRDRLYKLWKKNEKLYSDALYSHIGRHMELLGAKKR
ncbi:MAG: tagaturonate epimerase family protein [Christensenellales bacterium]|jgi:hypothetical protein